MTGIIRLPSGSDLERITNPQVFFRENKEDFMNIVQVVRDAFGTPMTEEDIYQHLTMPSKVYLLKDSGKVFGMCSYSPKILNGTRVLFVDGIAINPNAQGRGVFGEVTLIAKEDEKFVALKTQNPRMYRALEKFSHKIFPNDSLIFPERISTVMKDLADNLHLKVDSLMVARGFYGTSLYPLALNHQTASRLFDDILKVDYKNGDSVLCLGTK